MIVTVIGLGTFGAKTATRLFEKGAEGYCTEAFRLKVT